MTGRPPNPLKTYISIIYKLKKQTVIRFVDRIINELKINYFTYWFYKDKYYQDMVSQLFMATNHLSGKQYYTTTC